MLAVAGACALAAALGGGWWALRHRAPATAPATTPARLSGEVPPLARGKFVAILPFHFLGPANANYLALGMAESLSARLFQIPDVHLAGRDAPAPAASPRDWPAAARALGANLVVQGTVAEAGGRLRVIVTLDNAVTGGRV